ncbi:MAG: CoA transferase [Phenylobacterium sp.]|uniref:CaiB/BaiF CoA transferase family protein n=1 Tax=Phenylobacterium sp. TaxID=1871053 RepID=UPI0011F7B533|nr:CoA transferase [Phenylobacterium sp.]TAJ71849.1 MAG: CoA transferase [Phenylobacterium sp.]
MTATAPPSPLAGLRVLDLTRVLSGPIAGRMLCDLGADVVKVEPPEGDVSRLWGRQVAGIGGFFHQQNAGKRSVCLDLRVAEGRDLALRLAGRADILIENFRPDVMPRLGLGYPELRAANPRLIMLSISGFGAGGPQSRRAAYASVIHAESGLLARSARMSTVGALSDLPWNAADTNAGLHGAIAILAAVLLRARTGLGQHIDLGMLDASLVTDDNLHLALEGAEDLQGAPPDVWPSGAGPLLVAADTRLIWRRLAEVHGLADPAAPSMPQAEKIRLRRAAIAAFLAALPDWATVTTAMDRMNLAWGEVREARDLERHPTVRARGAIAQVDDGAGGRRPIPQSPYRFSDATSEVRGPAARRGQHNGDVLEDWLGLGAADVRRLADAGVLLSGAPP